MPVTGTLIVAAGAAGAAGGLEPRFRLIAVDTIALRIPLVYSEYMPSNGGKVKGSHMV